MDKIRNVKGMVGNGEKAHHDYTEPQVHSRSTYPQKMLRERESERPLQKDIPRPKGKRRNKCSGKG